MRYSVALVSLSCLIYNNETPSKGIALGNSVMTLDDIANVLEDHP